MDVNFTDSDKRYLPSLHIDYKDEPRIIATTQVSRLRSWNGWPSGQLVLPTVVMLSSKMPWDFWLIFAFLAVVIPWRGRVRLRYLLSLESVGTREKITLYATTMAFQWLLTLMVAWRALVRGLTAAEMGLSSSGSMRLLLPAVIGAFLLGGLHWLNLRRIGEMQGPAPEKIRALAKRILPRSLVELLPYFALAITAGVCEEFLYRGFAMAVLLKVGQPTWLAVLLTSVLFGLAHTYQGRSGVLGTTVMGIVLGGFRMVYANLVPVAIWHAVVDIVAGVAGRKYLLNEQENVHVANQHQQNQRFTG